MLATINETNNRLVVNADSYTPKKYTAIDFVCELINETSLEVTDFAGPATFGGAMGAYRITIAHNSQLSIYVICDYDVNCYTHNRYVVIPPFTNQTVYVPKRLSNDMGTYHGMAGTWYYITKQPSAEAIKEWKHAGCRLKKRQKHFSSGNATWKLFIPNNVGVVFK